MRLWLLLLTMKVSRCASERNQNEADYPVSAAANVGPWVRLAKQLNLTIRYWLPTPIDHNNPFSLHLDPAQLPSIVNGRTRLVAFTAKSNLLGHATDVEEAVRTIKERTGGRGMTVVDCVADCPHQTMDMKAWGCDAVMFSHYKASQVWTRG